MACFPHSLLPHICTIHFVLCSLRFYSNFFLKKFTLCKSTLHPSTVLHLPITLPTLTSLCPLPSHIRGFLQVDFSFFPLLCSPSTISICLHKCPWILSYAYTRLDFIPSTDFLIITILFSYRISMYLPIHLFF